MADEFTSTGGSLWMMNPANPASPLSPINPASPLYQSTAVSTQSSAPPVLPNQTYLPPSPGGYLVSCSAPSQVLKNNISDSEILGYGIAGLLLFLAIAIWTYPKPRR